LRDECKGGPKSSPFFVPSLQPKYNIARPLGEALPERENLVYIVDFSGEILFLRLTFRSKCVIMGAEKVVKLRPIAPSRVVVCEWTLRPNEVASGAVDGTRQAIRTSGGAIQFAKTCIAQPS
jgi:hypothetical protein